MTLRCLNRFFNKILKNEVDEPFYEIQGQIKKTIKGLLVKELERANPNTGAEAIQELADTNSKGKIPKSTATNIVNKLFAKDDGKKRELNEEIGRIIDNYAQTARKFRNKSGHGVSIADIKYKDLEKAILDSQLASHVAFLSNLRNLLRAMDKENFGYLNQEQLIDLIEMIKGDSEIDKEEVAKKVNPNEIEFITFSEIVEGFAKEYVNKDGQLINILEYIYLL